MGPLNLAEANKCGPSNENMVWTVKDLDADERRQLPVADSDQHPQTVSDRTRRDSARGIRGHQWQLKEFSSLTTIR
jgi:hypothetical protein